MANCKSMLEAFRLGGDFHSRTALGMYSHIREARTGRLHAVSITVNSHAFVLQAVDAGRCLLEWDGPEGSTPTAPLLKDMFAVERRKAKVRLTKLCRFCCVDAAAVPCSGRFSTSPSRTGRRSTG